MHSKTVGHVSRNKKKKEEFVWFLHYIGRGLTANRENNIWELHLYELEIKLEPDQNKVPWSHVLCHPREILTHYQVTKPLDPLTFWSVSVSPVLLFLFHQYHHEFCVSDIRKAGEGVANNLHTKHPGLMLTPWGTEGGGRDVTKPGHREVTRAPVTSLWPAICPITLAFPSASCHGNYAHSLASVNSYYAYTHYYY